MSKEQLINPLKKVDLGIVSMEACSIEEVKKSFANLADKEDLHLDADMMYARFIMCGEGANANGDYFTNEVLQRAQYTPRSKPINWEHGQPIIGTILDSHYAEDADGRGYIEAVGVVWKFVYPEFAEQIKMKSANGELKLSMECYFKDCTYKYGEQIFDQQQAEVLGIDAYYGREYMGQQVYRVFSDVIFGGVAVVANPADKGAVFLAVAKKNAEDAIHNNAVANSLTDEQIQSIAEIIRNTNDFREKILSKDTIDAVTIAKLVKAFDKAKSTIVGRFNKENIATKEQLVSEVRGIIDSLLTDVSNINNDYFLGLASNDSDILEGGESILVIEDLNLKLSDQVIVTEVAKEIEGGSEEMTKNTNEHIEPEAIATEDIVSTVEVEEVLVVADEKVIVEDVDTFDYKALATKLGADVSDLESKIQAKDTAFETLKGELDALKNKVEAKEKEEVLTSRMAELSVLGIELSEARKAKEVEKISGMDNDSFSDYKEFLSELMGSKVDVAQADETVEVDEVEEVEIEIDNSEKSTAGLNVETEQEKHIKPFSHLAE